jgi:Cu/Ag efflux pump CusA
VVIGGLVSSTLLTLLVIPSVYAWMMKRDAGKQAAAAVTAPAE